MRISEKALSEVVEYNNGLMDNKDKRLDEHLFELWNTYSEDCVSEKELQNGLEKFRGNRDTYIRQRRRRVVAFKILRYAAAVFLPVLTALAAWNYSAEYYAQSNDFTEFYVPEGRVDSLVLSDGTKVTVNSGTSLIYPQKFNPRSYYRNVYVSGSCRFAVAKDRSHPFVVNLGSLKVRVLGTHFSVSYYSNEDNITVTLEEGLVKVSDNSHSMTLHPNEQLVYSRMDGKMTKLSVDALSCNSWVNGNLDFTCQPLSEIIKTLERRYNVRFRVMEGVDTDKRYTMSFRREESVESVMKVLVMVSGNISCTKRGNRITISRK